MKQKTGDAVRLFIALVLALIVKQFLAALPPEAALLLGGVISFVLTVLGSIIIDVIFARPAVQIVWAALDSGQDEDGRLQLRRAANGTAAQLYEIRVSAKTNSVIGKVILARLGNSNDLALEIKIVGSAKFGRERTPLQLNDEQTVMTLPLQDVPEEGSHWHVVRASIEVETAYLNYKSPIKYRLTMNGQHAFGIGWIKRDTPVRQLFIKDTDA